MTKNKYKINFVYFFLFFLITFFLCSYQIAEEILIYADEIYYDKNENLIGKGKAKILYQNQIINSELIIYNKISNELIIPKTFTYKDNQNNFFYGTEGSFNTDFTKGIIKDVKILLNDGSRIVGDKFERENNIDIISKGVYSPCKSKIKIKNFICPTWQLEGEKILHDNENLLLYQKHSKMRVLNIPVFYLPYIVTPSPLRKKRKSGFLNPSINFNFFDTKVSQSTSLPYYFNISEDKELTFTPTINYGGGVDSSQRFLFQYNQLISGGSFSTDISIDSKFEEQNNNKWLSDASLITNYKKNVNAKYTLDFKSALETSKNYIQSTDPNNNLSYTSSLATTINLNGYNLRKIDDKLLINFSTYQTNQNNEDNSAVPTVLPFVNYKTGIYKYNQINYENEYEFYNIFRDKKTNNYSKEQQKLSHNLSFSKKYIDFNSNIILQGQLFNQLYNTTKKDIKNSETYSGNSLRSFPIFGINIETPFKLQKNLFDFIYKPSLSLILSPGKSNSEKISNEDSSLNTHSSNNEVSLNRYSGNDKLDNSKRLVSQFMINNNNLTMNLSQSYEFTDNSNFHKDSGNDENLGDLLGSLQYINLKNEFEYNFRYDHSKKYLKQQNINYVNNNSLGSIELSYLDQNSESDSVITNDIETLNYTLTSNKINKYSKIGLTGLYDLKKSINTEYGLNYSYFDECFGINIDFNRKSYTEDNLRPQDTLTIMFSFKNVGSYRSTNLAVSENDKQDIRWESNSVKNELFN
jgi:LPS-assembly protein